MSKKKKLRPQLPEITPVLVVDTAAAKDAKMTSSESFEGDHKIIPPLFWWNAWTPPVTDARGNEITPHDPPPDPPPATPVATPAASGGSWSWLWLVLGGGVLLLFLGKKIKK